ncbi:MAG: hypothetical protein ABJB86_10595 [Bacteroidota bacterium]
MRNTISFIFAFFFILTNTLVLTAQDSTASCRVVALNLLSSYKGACKNGLANGQGDAVGIHHYTGNFRDGIPNGYGTYYYDDSTYYMGYFQDGVKEGKGEAHYLHKGRSDSAIKGYWSGNEFRGKKYITYDFDGGSKFDRYDINATPDWGHTISFEIYTTTGSPLGIPNDLHDAGYVLRVDDITAASNAIIRLLSKVDTFTRSYSTYDLNTFPIILYVHLSNGESFKLHLYKNAKWTVRLYVNK